MERVIQHFYNFTDQIENITLSEDFNSYLVSFELLNLKKHFKLEDLTYIENFVNSRDKLLLDISIDSGDPIKFLNEQFKEQEESQLKTILNELEEDSEIKISYKIIKNSINFVKSIYDIDLLCNSLKKLNFLHLLNNLKNHLSIDHLNKLELQNTESDKVYFRSSLFIIASKEVNFNTEPLETLTREQVLLRRTNNSNAQSFSNYNFIPSDFNNLITKNVQEHDITLLLHKIKVVLSTSFLSNTSNIKENDEIHLTFFGHKHIETSVLFTKLDVTKSSNFFDIYKWIFEKDNTHEKLELARNIITRYFSYNENLWVLPTDTLSSIQSAHAIYLKENVEKYIETKNKVAEITTELSVKSKEITQFFISNFKNNNLTLLTYFISLFIFNSLSNNADKQIFNIEKYYISMFFLLISLVYLLITRYQLFKDVRINIHYFYSMKRIYKDIFDNKELNNLFHKKHLKYNIKEVKKTINMYSYFWLLEVILLAILAIMLTFFIQI